MLERLAQFPVGAQVTMANLSSDPYPLFRRLQVEEPVSWIPEIQMWYITRREDVLKVLADTQTFTVEDETSTLRRFLGYNMLTTDGDEQRRLRKPFVPTFAANAVRSGQNIIENQAHHLIDSWIHNVSADLVSQFADPLALVTVTAFLGIPMVNYEEFRGWYVDLNAALGNFTNDNDIEARGHHAKNSLAHILQQHINRLRAAPDDSILSQMVQQNNLSDTKLIDAVRVIIFGGLETTAALLANTIWALLNHPAQAELVKQDQANVKRAVEETMRWESPVQTCTRHITTDTTLSGITLRAGERLQCMLGAANRDSSHFDQPDVFDIQRANAHEHVGFGSGKHFCIGAALARLEAQVGLKALFDRLPHLRLADSGQRPQGHEFRSPAKLAITWDR